MAPFAHTPKNASLLPEQIDRSVVLLQITLSNMIVDTREITHCHCTLVEYQDAVVGYNSPQSI